MSWVDGFHDYLRNSARFWVEEEASRYAYLTGAERKALERKKQTMKERGVEIVKTVVDGRILNQLRMEAQRTVHYGMHVRHLIRQGNDFYIEEEMAFRRALFEEEKLVSDEPFAAEGSNDSAPAVERDKNDAGREPFRFRRLEAVRYADRWWNSYNPEYRHFENDCTNFISQCLRAGGSPMRGHPNRSRGWWYSGSNWSYSWSVANALRWYLPGSHSGLRAKQLSSPDELIPGDVIAYDFEGDGAWEHNTIVTAKDRKGMPLVNAHTTNCRFHYWDYRDSVAWTPQIQYKFFRILGDE